MDFQTLPAGSRSTLDQILDASAHATRKATAADLHAAQREGVTTGAKPDTLGSIRAFAANAAGMVYLDHCLQMRVRADIRNRDRKPYPGTDPRHIKGATRKMRQAGVTTELAA